MEFQKVDTFMKSEKDAKSDPFNTKLHHMNCYMYECSAEELYAFLCKIDSLLEQNVDEILVLISDDKIYK